MTITAELRSRGVAAALVLTDEPLAAGSPRPGRDETRERRVAETLRMLADGRTRG